MYDPSGHDDYCDTHSCAFRATCSRYKQAYPKPVSPEEAEQMTLQWATRMGGVSNAAPTVIHSVDDGGQPTSTIPDFDTQPNGQDLAERLEELLNEGENDGR